MPDQRPPLPSLTGLRFVAAALVLVFHFAPGQGFPPEVGPAAVTLFFLLSGFVLTYAAPARPRTWAFYAARLGRIYPAYLLGLGLAALPALAGTVRPSRWCPAPRAALLPTLAMVQSWDPHVVQCLNGPAWSVSCEMFFYTLFPLLLPCVRTLRGRALLRALVLVWLGALAIPLMLIALHPSGNAGGVAFRLVHLSPVARLPDFVAGMLLGRVWVTGTRLPRPGLCATGAALAAPLLPVLAPPFVPLQDVLLWPSFAVLLLALAHNQGVLHAVLASPALVVLGEASYGLYILHWPVYDRLTALGLASPVASGWPYFLAYGALMVALALLSLRYVERPARRAIRRLASSGAG